METPDTATECRGYNKKLERSDRRNAQKKKATRLELDSRVANYLFDETGERFRSSPGNDSSVVGIGGKRLSGCLRSILQVPTTATATERLCAARRCSKTKMPCQVPSISRPSATGMTSLDRVSTERRCEVVSSWPSAVWT